MNRPLFTGTSRTSRPLTRRTLLRRGTLCLAGLGGLGALAETPQARPLVRAGLMTDLHYGEKPDTRTRFYRQALAKLDEAVDHFNTAKPAFVVELGDFIDQAETAEEEAAWLATMEQHYARLQSPRHYVLGNHCVATLTKAEFARHTAASPEPHYAFDQEGVRFIVLDACYREDGAPYGRRNADWKDANVPPAELAWLQTQLASASGPVIVFAHQRLDDHGPHSVRNAPTVRAVLEKSASVLAVFQGHSHMNDLQQIQGIPYVTLAAMIEGTGPENSGYAMLEVMADSSLRLHGFRRQTNRSFERPKA